MDKEKSRIENELYNAIAFLKVANLALSKYEGITELGEIYCLYNVVYKLLREIEDSF